MKKLVLIITAAFLSAIIVSKPASLQAQKGQKQKEPKITDTRMEEYYPEGKVMASGEIKKIDGKPIRHGAWTIFTETGEKVKEGAYKEDKMDGLWVQFFKSGKINSKSNYQEGKLNGTMETYYESGNKKSEEQYVMDVLHGRKLTYYEDGKMESDTNYSNGKKNGPEKLYYPDEKLKSEATYANDKKNGIAKTYHPDGTTISIFATYDNGSLKGPWFTNYQKGNRKIQGQYVPAPKKTGDDKLAEEKIVEGHRTGMWTFFHDNGKKAMEGAYSANNKEGKWKTFAPEGYLSSEGVYVKDSQNGVWNYYTSKGELEKKLTLSGGLPNGKGWMYESGKLSFEGNYTGLPNKLIKSGAGKEFYPNGVVLKSEGSYMMDRKDGPYKEYHPNGKLKATGSYVNDKRNEVWNFYKDDGVTKDQELSGYYMMGTINKAFSPGTFEFKPSFQ